MSGQRGSTISRIRSILEQVADADEPLSASEINQALDLPKSSALCLCGRLEQLGFLRRDLDGRHFLPGPMLRGLAAGVLSQTSHGTAQHAILEDLSRDIGESCNLAYPDGTEMVYADRVEAHWPLRLQVFVGSRVPLYCTASGKMYLSTLRKKQRERVIDHLDLVPHTRNSFTDKAQLREELRKIRKQGYSEDEQEQLDGMIALAVAVNDRKHRACGTVSFHATVSRMSLETARAYVPRLQLASEALSREIR